MKGEIFRAYDVRGDYPTGINEDLAYRLGRAVVVFLKADRIVIGRDCRASSKDLADALIRGITDQGADVTDSGLCSTPMINFASKNDHAIMITASHLPAHKNGFKIFKKGAISIGIDNGLRTIKELVDKNAFQQPHRNGDIIRDDIIPAYTKHILSFVRTLKKMTIVIDAGNGMAGYTTPYLFVNLHCTLVRLFFDLNGSFPNRSPNPLDPGSLTKLSQTVVTAHADFGAAYDADCDRIVFVDEHGKDISSDLIIALLAQFLIGRKKENVVYELTCSKIVPETIRALKCNPVMSRVGHSFMQQTMQAKKALFGGERSGHYFYRDNFSSDSGDITLMLIMSLLSKTDKKLSELVAPLKKYTTFLETIPTRNGAAIVAAVTKTFSEGKITRVDGITIEFADWWFNLRPSNTDAIIRLTIESKSKTLAAQKLREILAIVKQYS